MIEVVSDCQNIMMVSTSKIKINILILLSEKEIEIFVASFHQSCVIAHRLQFVKYQMVQGQ